MGLVYDPGRWPTALWQRHVDRFPTAQTIIEDGTTKQPQFPGFSEDVHSALYLRTPPEAKPDAPAWATDLLTQAEALPEWSRLQARCRSNGFLAGVAAERMLSAILPLLPEQERQEPKPTDPPGKPQDGAGKEESFQVPGTGTTAEGQPDGDAGGTRRALRQACREASAEVDQAEKGVEALQQALGRHQGHGPGQAESLKDLDDVQSLYAMIRDNPTLRHIADLAGRLSRLGQAHKKTHVQPAVGAIKGVTLGGDLERLLPSELVGLRSKSTLLRLQTLERIFQKRALQYLWRGDDSLTRGPLIVLVDESGSMGNGVGTAGAWSKAVVLALLTSAIQQRRAFHLVGFSGLSRADALVSHWHKALNHELHVDAGQVVAPDALSEALLWGCNGGTSFDAPLHRALDVWHDSADMQKADVVMITDGEATVSPEVNAAYQAARAKDGLHLYAVLVGKDATGHSLESIAAQMWHVSGTLDSATVAPLLAQVS